MLWPVNALKKITPRFHISVLRQTIFWYLTSGALKLLRASWLNRNYLGGSVSLFISVLALEIPKPTNLATISFSPWMSAFASMIFLLDVPR